MVPAGISLFGHFRQKDRIPFLSSFHQLVHVTGYLPVGNLCIDLRTVDVRMAHHLGDALYRDAGGQHQGSERMAGHVENTFHLRNWKNIENKLVTGCELADFLYSASVIGKQFGTEY